MDNEPPDVCFADLVVTGMEDGTFVRLVMSRAAASSVERLQCRCIQLRGTLHLSVTKREGASDVTENIAWGGARQWLITQLAECSSALLCTTRRDWQFSRPAGATMSKARLVSHKPSTKLAPARAHDLPANTILDATASDWLGGLAVTGADGRVRARMADKHRQINRYLELLSHLAADCGWKKGQSLTLADMGCGKGYLTFGAWHWLRRVQGIGARVIGVDARQELVDTCNDLARGIGAEGLAFMQGRIESVELPGLDGLIALHACDTATDAAILRGVRSGAKLVVVAPCCHKEVRPQLKHPGALGPVLRHGIMAERMSEWVTDGLRALYLEWAGYRTKVMEFVATEHTPKNLMIAGVRAGEGFMDAAARHRITALKEQFGIERHSLDALLEEGK